MPKATNNTDGKPMVALITGGTTGIGRTTALQLAASGYAVVINYRNYERKRIDILSMKRDLEKIGADYLFVEADVAVESEIKKMIRKIKETFGHLSVLINNAAVFIQQPFPTLSAANLDKHLLTNLRGAILVTRHALALFNKTLGGRIIFISSTSAFTYHANSNCFSYAVSKAALLGVTRGLASELAPSILVNCVVPVYIKTPMMLKTFSPKDLRLKEKRTLLQRFGTPEEVASLICYLVSPAASYITGQALHINGGRWFA